MVVSEGDIEGDFDQFDDIVVGAPVDESVAAQ